jgi:hypothetical protein
VNNSKIRLLNNEQINNKFNNHNNHNNKNTNKFKRPEKEAQCAESTTYMQQYSSNGSYSCYPHSLNAQNLVLLGKKRFEQIHILLRTQCHRQHAASPHVGGKAALEWALECGRMKKLLAFIQKYASD